MGRKKAVKFGLCPINQLVFRGNCLHTRTMAIHEMNLLKPGPVVVNLRIHDGSPKGGPQDLTCPSQRLTDW